MMMMTIPSSFKWTNIPEQTLNSLSIEKKRAFLKKEEIKIRQCLGEAVPTAIFDSIAEKIAFFFSRQHLSDAEVKKLIDTTDLGTLDSVISYISANFDTVGISSISKVVEYANAKREHNAAFFTDKSILNEIMKYLPDIDKDVVRILEPSVGTGNFVPFIIKKYAAVKSIIIDVVDIDPDVISVLKYIISKFRLPANVTINFITDDFLLHKFNERYDLVIGNPPFNKLGSNNKSLKLYRAQAVNSDTTNTFSFFLEKAVQISDYVSLIVPKFLLNTPEFRKTREILERKHIDSIIDFGENGFKGVLVETVCVNINTLESAAKTTIHSMTEQVTIIQKQSYITDPAFPYWLIYRNDFFDKIAKRLTFDVFTVFRDRQITNKLLSAQGDIRVVKSRNINDSGTQIVNIEGYDSYISADNARQLSVYAYYETDNVYLTPNMTYKPRLIKKPPYVLVNGSVAILTLKDGYTINETQRGYFSTDEYRAFYKIARNYQTRSLNVDSNSVFFFGLLKEV